MGALTTAITVFDRVLSPLLRLGRMLGWMMMGLMVAIVILQVILRYVFNNALPWPEEAARFLMLWMTGLVAPSAYRWGGFVAIDMLKDLLPKRAGALLGLVLLVLSLIVLVTAAQFGWKHVNSGWLFASSSLKLPLGLIGLKAVSIKLAWVYMSMFVGVLLMIAVNIEHILRSIAQLIDPDYQPPAHPDHLDLATE